MNYQENVNLFKMLLQEGKINEVTESLGEIMSEIIHEFTNQYPEIFELIEFLLQGQDINKFDFKLIPQRYAIYKNAQNGNSHKFSFDKTYWLTFIEIVRLFMPTKEPILREFVAKYCTEVNFHVGFILCSVYMNIDLTEASKFIQDLSGGLIPILIEWFNNPNDTKKFKNEIELMMNKTQLSISKQKWIDMGLKSFFMNEESFGDIFIIYLNSIWAALNSNLNEAVESLLKFDQDNLKEIKSAKRELQGIEDNYDHVETFAPRVEEYGERVKQIKHQTNLYMKLVDENSKINMLSFINDDVENFRMKKRKLNTDINSTLRDLIKTKALLIGHRFRMHTVKSLSYYTILIGIFLNSLTENQKKKEQIDDQLIANLVERSSEVIETIIEDLDEIIEQKSKVLDKIGLIDKIKADFKEWHQIEKLALESLSRQF